MDDRKELLLASAARLYSVWLDLEAARERLKEFAEKGVSYQSDKMKQAYEEFRRLNQEWKALKQRYLELREEILFNGKMDNQEE